MDIRGALKEGMARLREAHTPSHTLAAELLMIRAVGRDRTWLYTHPEHQIEPETLEHYFALVARRATGEPTQYLTGKQEFWGLEFEVSPAVLIPRPETEHVVEVVLERLGPRGIKIRLDTGAPSPGLRVADVGTGSGCLAVALAYELPHAEVFATDISVAALQVARRNAARYGMEQRVRFFEANLLDAFVESSASGKKQLYFDVVASNPPYVALEDAGTLAPEVRDHEPQVALFGGRTGVEMYARLIDQARLLLRDRGVLALELGYNCAGPVAKMVREQPGWVNVSLTNDLAGIPRVLAAERLG